MFLKYLLLLISFVSVCYCDTGLDKVLVAGGNGFLPSVEILDLTDSNSTCQNLPDLPVGLEGASGALFQDAIPIVCGGYKSGKITDSCDCFGYENGTWRNFPSLSECRRYAGSTIVKIYNQETGDPEELFLVSGGHHDSDGTRSSVELFNGQHWIQDKISDLPDPVQRHCIIQLNETTLFSIGGFYNESYLNQTYFYNIDEDLWYPGPELNVARFGHSCGIINWQYSLEEQEEQVLVVAGGYNGGLLRSSELLFLNPEFGDFEFALGPDLPRPISLSQMIEYEDSVIVVGGGYGQDGYSLYQLDSPEGQWIQLGQKILDKRRAHVAFRIPDYLTNCN